MVNFFFFENRAVYEVMWNNVTATDRPQTEIKCGAEKCDLPTG